MTESLPNMHETGFNAQHITKLNTFKMNKMLVFLGEIILLSFVLFLSGTYT